MSEYQSRLPKLPISKRAQLVCRLPRSDLPALDGLGELDAITYYGACRLESEGVLDPGLSPELKEVPYTVRCLTHEDSIGINQKIIL